MTTEQRKAAVRKRAVIKSQVTRFGSFLDNFSDDSNINQLKERKNHLRDHLAAFDEIQGLIESLSTDTAEYSDDERERAAFEDVYFELQAKAQQLLDRLEPAPSLPAPTTSVTHNLPAAVNHNNTVHEPLPNVRLPTINLPRFSGKYEDWLGFYDTFKCIIHEDNRISNVQKLHYLRSCLEAEAAQTIQSIETSAENYAVAWALIRERYDNRRIIIQNHIRQLFDLPNVTNESATHLRSLLDNALKHVRALEALGQPTESWGAMLLHLINTKLDRKTHTDWERSISGTLMPSIEDFWTFLRNRCHVLENVSLDVAVHQKRHIKLQSRDAHQNQSRVQKVYVGTQPRTTCKLCKGPHNLQHCDRYLKLNRTEKSEFIKKSGLCYNCLGANHLSNICKSTNCRICNKRHHTSLHILEAEENSHQQGATSDSHTVKALQAITPFQVLLSTASVLIRDKFNKFHSTKSLMDSGSQSNFITERLAKKLGLNRERIDIPVSGFNTILMHLKYSVTALIKSSDGRYAKELKFLVIPKITEHLPAQQIDRRSLKIPNNVSLADPNFHKPSEIDMLIGAELFYSLLCIGQIALNEHGAILQKTRLGWIVAGGTSIKTNIKSASCHLITNSLDDEIKRFWELEEYPQVRRLSVEENACEAHFKQNTCRDNTGRYQVRLPFKGDKFELGHSYDTALRRFKNLERRLSQDLNRKSEYSAFLREYLSLGHMSEISECRYDDHSYYMPHHAVVKDTSATTKLRVVFDASAKTSTRISLNDVLMVGPKIQEDLYSIVTRFRTHAYVLSADLEKMYRQVKLHDDDTRYQRILWRDNSSEPVKIYELNTLTYGTASASFLATRCLSQLAEDEAVSFPDAIEVLKRDFYVDDLLTGTNDIQSALNLRNNLIQLLKRSGFNIRQWLSNDKRLLESIPLSESKMCLYLNDSTVQKTLGIKWNFIPARSPHFDGIWEAAVKIFKHHWKRTIGDCLLTFEEFNTFAIEVEAIMNSRPLTPLSSDPNDLTALCPNHFLIGDSMLNIPERDLRDVAINRLSCWEHIQQKKQHFWNRWYKEYINELNQRSKWYSAKTCNIKIGSLVLLKDDNLPSLKWALGRIIELHPGSDDIVRVVTVKTIDGTYKRAVKKIAPLPLENNM